MHPPDSPNPFRSLDHLTQNLFKDLARDLSTEITKDLTQHPEDALAIIRVMSGSNNDMPKGFASAFDLFGSNQNNYHDGSSNQPLENVSLNPFVATNDISNWFEDPSLDRYLPSPSDISSDLSKFGHNVFSDIESVGNNIADVGDAIGSKVGSIVHDVTDDVGDFFSSVGSVAHKIFPFF